MFYSSHMPTRLGQQSWYIRFLRQKGSSTGSKKNNFSEPEKLFFLLSGWTHFLPLHRERTTVLVLMWLESRFHWLEAAFWKNNFSEPEKLIFSGHPQLHFDVLRKHFGPDSSPVFLEQHVVVSYGPDESAALIKACVKKFCSKERRLTEATSFYRKGGVVRQRIRKVRSDVGHKRTNYQGKPAKPEHARLLSSCSSGFAAPEPGVMVSTILDEMSPPKRSKT